MKNVITIRHIVSMVLTVFFTGEIFADVSLTGVCAPTSAAYTRYVERHKRKSGLLLAGQEERHVLEFVPQAQGLIPTKVDFGYLTNYTSHALLRGPNELLPSKYDPRENGVTPVRHQDPTDIGIGTCWAQATIGSIETWLKQQGTDVRFSVRHMVNNSGMYFPASVADWESSPWHGATLLRSAAYLLRWNGPVLESEDPYVDPYTGELRLSYDSPVVVAKKHQQYVYLIPARKSSTDNDALKRAILSFGGVAVTMTLGAYSEDTSSVNHYLWNLAHPGAYYLPISTDPGHAVTVVGWDDSYSKDNFAEWPTGSGYTKPEGNGAFIVKDSYGNDTGRDNGYMYVSYYDAVFGKKQPSFAFPLIEETNNYSRVYQYDPYGWIDQINLVSSGVNYSDGYAATMFKSVETEKLSAVGFYATAPSTQGNPSSYTISIYTGCTLNNPSSGTLACTQSGSMGDYAGYKTVKLDAPVSVGKGETFSVVCYLSTPGTTPFVVEMKDEDSAPNATASRGQSFFSLNGKDWVDAIDVMGDDSVNFCCKAYMQKACELSMTPSGLSATAASDGSKVTLSWNYTSANATFYIYRGEVDSKPSNYTYTKASATSGAITYEDTSVTSGTTYYYWVTAKQPGDNYAESEAVGPVSATPIKTLESISIVGKDSAGNKVSTVVSGGKVYYTCTATYTDKSTAVVNPLLSISPEACGSFSGNTFTASPMAAQQYGTVLASYNEGNVLDGKSATCPLTVLASTAVYHPANDNFANAIAIAGPSGSTSGTTVGATVEGEEYCIEKGTGMAANTVWWSWTATDDGKLTLSTKGSGIATALDVFTGDLKYGRRLKWDYSISASSYASVEVTVTKGTKYNIRIAGYNNAEGAVSLTWSLVALTKIAAPTDFTAVYSSANGRIELTWKKGAAYCHYKIYRAESIQCPDIPIDYYKKTSMGTLSYNDTSLSSGATYWYWVSATKDDYADSDPVGPVSVKVPAEGSELPDLNFDYVPEGWPQAVFLTTDKSSANKVTSFTEGDVIYLFGAFYNGGYGTTPVGIDLRLEIIDSNGNVVASCDETLDGYLESGDPAWLAGGFYPDFQCLKPGSYTFRCTLDADEEIEETSESNNVAEYAFTVKVRDDSPASDFTYGNWMSGIAITGYKGDSTAVAVPPVIGDKAVIGLANKAFVSKTNLTYLKLPSGLIAIGEMACSYCSNLVSVVIPESVAGIGSAVFWNCESLCSIALHEGIKAIEYGTFYGCRSLPKISIPEGVTNIAEYAFQGCSRLVSVEIPQGVKSIGKQAFCYCAFLESIVIPASVTSIGKYAFYGCRLETVYVDSEEEVERVRGLLTNSGFDCTGRTFEVLTPDNPDPARVAIEKPTANTSLVYNGHLQQGYSCCDARLTVSGTGSATAAGNYSVTFTLPAATATEMFTWADDNSTTAYKINWSIEPRNVNDSSVTFAAIPDQTYTGAAIKPSVTMTYAGVVRTEGANADYTVDYSSNVDVGTACAKVKGHGNFTGERTLTFAILDSPDPVSMALDNVELTFELGGEVDWTVSTKTPHSGGSCMISEGLAPDESASIMTTVEGSGVMTFWMKLNTLADGEYLEVCIDDQTMSYYSGGSSSSSWSEEQLVVPTGTHTVTWKHSNGNVATSGLVMIDSVTWTPKPSTQGYWYDVVNGKAVISRYVGAGGDVVIPSSLDGYSVVEIGQSAFESCTSLTAVTVPSSVTNIEAFAFAWCDNLVEADISESVRNISEYAFIGCQKMTAFVVDSENAYYKSSQGVLYTKDGLTLLCCPAGMCGTFTVPPGVNSVAPMAFAECYGLTSIVMTTSVASIGYAAFMECTGLVSAVIPSSVASIATQTFAGCIGLTSLTIPPSVTSIEEYAFVGCEAIDTVFVDDGDTNRVRGLLEDSGLDCSGITFVESTPVHPTPTLVAVNPVLVTGASTVEVFTNGTVKVDGSAPYMVYSNASVRVVYTADAGYEFAGGATIYEIALTADKATTEVSIPLQSRPTKKSVYVEVEKPAVDASLVYSGLVQLGVTNIDMRLIVRSGVASATDAGDYTAKIALPARIAETNYVWKGETDAVAKSNDLLFAWSIAQRAITLTSASDSKVWDGSPLANGTVTVSGAGFVSGEGFSYSVTGSQTDVGSSPNSFTYSANPGTKTNNYAVTKIEGSLVVTPIVTHTVTFNAGEHGKFAGDKTSVDVEVNHGAAATAPALTVDSGWKFTVWDKTFDDVTADMTVNALYEETGGSHPVPDWTVVTKPNKMNVYARILDVQTQEYLIHPEAKLAAFIGDECRGSTTFITNKNRNVFALSVGIDSTAEKGFTLKYWNPERGILDVIDGFDANDARVIGGISSPVTYRVGVLSIDITLNSGWNWVSFPVRPDDTSVNSVLSEFTFADGDIIDSATGVSTYDAGEWISGDFDDIVPGAGYCIKKSTAGSETVTVLGGSIDNRLEVSEGWNWIGCPSLQEVPMSDVTHSGGFSQGDVIDSANGVTTYDLGEWISGDFESLTPGAAYTARFANSGTLTFGAAKALFSNTSSVSTRSVVALTKESSALLGSNASSVTSTWVSVTKEKSFHLYCKVTKGLGGSLVNTKGSVLAAFSSNGECRGRTSLITSGGRNIFALKINAETESEKGFVLKVWDASVDAVYDVDGTIGFSDCDNLDSKSIGSTTIPATKIAIVSAYPTLDDGATPAKIIKNS